MAAEIFAGAAAGALFAEVIVAVKKVINTIKLFKPRLEKICLKLITLKPLVVQIMSLNEKLDLPTDELEPINKLLSDCKKLVEKCQEIKSFDVVARNSHSRSLFELECSLNDFCTVTVALINNRDIKDLIWRFEQANANKQWASSVVLEPEEEEGNTVLGGFALKTDTMADLVSGTLVGALIAELLSVKQAIETTHLEIIESTLESLKTQIQRQINEQLPNCELRPIHNLLEAGLALIRKCRMLKKSQFWDKQSYTLQKVDDDIDNGILRFCRIDLAGILVGDVKFDRVDVSGLIVEMEMLSQLLEKDSTNENNGKIGFNYQRLPSIIVGLNTDSSQFKSCNVPLEPEYFVGFNGAPFQDILKKLLKGKEPLIVISAAEGYGKTTLVTKLCHHPQVTRKYKDIIFVVASESTNLMALIQQIINHLGGKVPDSETQNEDDAVQLLQQLLGERAKQNPILLVLDDFWCGAESIVKKFVNRDILNYTVLVTSRSEIPVPGIGFSHQLKRLEHEDAVQLLRHVAVLSDNSNLPLPSDIDKVAEQCEGLPLTLKVVGESLWGKPNAAWQEKLKEWCNGTSLPNNMRSLLNSLKGLDGNNGLDWVKHCFLDLGSFPEDHKICVATLIDIWSELYNMGMDDAIAAIMELYARSLVNLANRREHIIVEDGYYNDYHVMQSTILVRGLTIHLNSEGPIEERERLNLEIRNNQLPEWTLLKQPLKARLVSIYTDEHFEAEAWPDLELRAAEVLVLLFKAKKKYTLPKFIENMENLKALIVINTGHGDLPPVEVNNLQVIDSLGNLKKIRLEKVKIASLTSSPDFSLDNLEKISTFLCDISEGIPTSNLIPFPEVYPKLEEIDISYCANLKTLPYEICDAAHLKTISVTNCHQLSELPEEIGKLSELQVLRLNSCTGLKKLPDSICDLYSLNFLDFSNCYNIYKLPKRLGGLQQLKKLNLSWCLELSSLPASVSKLRQLEYLTVDKDRVNFHRFFKNNPKLNIKVAEEERSLNFISGFPK